MHDEKPRKSHVGPLLTFLLFVIVVALLLDFSPFYYKRLFNIGQTNQDTPGSNTSSNIQSAENADIRASLENGGSISFAYNYVPSERDWYSMYDYCIFRHGPTGDFTFSCDRLAEKRNEPLCTCLFSQSVWDELLDLILNHGKLVDCSSVYDTNGKVVSTRIAKTIKLSTGGIYSPSNIGEIEAFFKRLAIVAGADSSDLEWNVPIDDANIEDKTTVILHGTLFNDYDPFFEIPDYDIAPEMEQYLRQKYEETGVRMYILLFNSDDIEALTKEADEMLELATSPAMAFGLTRSQKEWVFRYRMNPEQQAKLDSEYSVVAYDYYMGTYNAVDRLKNAIVMAYRLL